MSQTVHTHVCIRPEPCPFVLTERTFRYPGGYVRQDPKHIRVWATKEDPPSAEYWKPHARDRQMHVEKAPSTVFPDAGLLRSALQNH